ncbi:sigma-70 family RNA polymerase sigma factor [Ornithinimicrobium sp. Arc0846-15]|nr:sigma-70 family RNA polymerase sigma factor [Ornithinimicrobium laminariae]
MSERIRSAGSGVDADAEIARSFQRGDEGSFAQVYQRWASLVFGLAKKAVGPFEAEDVTQQVFVAAWQSKDRFDPEYSALGAWLVGITRHKVADSLRRGPSSREMSVDPTSLSEELSDNALNTGMAPERIDVLLTLAQELERIGDPQRHILVLSFVHDMTMAQIAEHLSMPLGTVKSHHARTLRRLRAEMEVKDAH